MSERELKQLLKEKRVRRSWRCPDDTRLAAYTEQNLDAVARQSIEKHLVSCDSCLEQVAFLIKSGEWTDHEQVPQHILVRARNLVPRTEGQRGLAWGWSFAAAAAACLVIAFVVMLAIQLRRPSTSTDNGLVAQSQPQPSPLPLTVATPNVTEKAVPKETARSVTAGPKPFATTRPSAIVRGTKDSGEISLSLIQPAEQAVMKTGEVPLRWNAVSDALSYEVNVTTEDGSLVINKTTEQPQLKVSLKQGAKYFVQVSANMRQGKTVRSRVVSFRVAP